MTRRRAYVVLVFTLVLASCLLLAQQTVPTTQYNTQGVTPPPGSNPTPAKMTFFVTSVGISKGGNLGGLAGADAHCQAIATAVGAGGHSTPISALRLVPGSPPSTRVTASAKGPGSIGRSRNWARRRTPSFQWTSPTFTEIRSSRRSAATISSNSPRATSMGK
jgi:hypothetical protein